MIIRVLASYRYTVVDLHVLHVVQYSPFSPIYKRLRLGPEVSNCLFWNKE